MAYNFPVNYYPYQMPAPQMQAGTQMSLPQTSTGVIWVQGEAGAKSYLVAPNSTVYLWDSESHTIYVKSADASGMPSIKVLDYKVRNTTPVEKNPEYATRDELESIRKQLEQLRKEVAHESDANNADADAV